MTHQATGGKCSFNPIIQSGLYRKSNSLAQAVVETGVLSNSAGRPWLNVRLPTQGNILTRGFAKRIACFRSDWIKSPTIVIGSSRCGQCSNQCCGKREPYEFTQGKLSFCMWLLAFPSCSAPSVKKYFCSIEFQGCGQLLSTSMCRVARCVLRTLWPKKPG